MHVYTLRERGKEKRGRGGRRDRKRGREGEKEKGIRHLEIKSMWESVSNVGRNDPSS